MNPIEVEGRPLKAHEISGQRFEDDYDLALAGMKAMQARSEKGKYSLERFKFNSA